jgi:hypothetical protein
MRAEGQLSDRRVDGQRGEEADEHRRDPDLKV